MPKTSKTSKAPKAKARWIEPGTYQNPPQQQLKVPDPITIHDLTPDQRENQIVITGVNARKWDWKPGCPR